MFWGSKETRLDSLLGKSPIVDTHNDFPYLLRSQLHYEFNSDENFDFNNLTCHTDLAKLSEGKVGVQFFSCYIECKNPDYLYQDFNEPNSAVRDTLEQIDCVKRLVTTYSDRFEFVNTHDQALKAYKAGKIAITLGVEGLHQVDTSLAVVRLYYELGVRYITLTHNCDNPFATAASSTVAGLEDKGLTDYGRDCVLEMNRLGMMVDLSHVSLQTMKDALEVTKAPVIFSHSSAYAVTANERNVRDEVLLKVKENGGVVCVNFYPNFIHDDPEKATIDDAVDHILHIISVIGWDHVGFGSDFDGIEAGPIGLENVSKYPDLIQKIIEKGSPSDDQIAGVMGGNVMRVWQKCEAVAKQLTNKPASEKNWPDRIWEFYDYIKTFPELYPGAFNAKNNTYIDSQALDLTSQKKA